LVGFYFLSSKIHPRLWYNATKSAMSVIKDNQKENIYIDYFLFLCDIYEEDVGFYLPDRFYLIPACFILSDNIFPNLKRSRKDGSYKIIIVENPYPYVHKDNSEEDISAYKVTMDNLTERIRELLCDSPLPEEIVDLEKYPEGAKLQIAINRYERSAKARRMCIEHYGTKCAVCDFNFSDKYGEIGTDLIYVHHIIPLSEIGNDYSVDPIKDLRPICPDCHAVIHKNKLPYTIEEVKRFIDNSKLKT